MNILQVHTRPHTCASAHAEHTKVHIQGSYSALLICLYFAMNPCWAVVFGGRITSANRWGCRWLLADFMIASTSFMKYRYRWREEVRLKRVRGLSAIRMWVCEVYWNTPNFINGHDIKNVLKCTSYYKQGYNTCVFPFYTSTPPIFLLHLFESCIYIKTMKSF